METSRWAGPAAVAGACVTLPKALFDDRFVIPDPVVGSSDGLSLVTHTGLDADQFTVPGEPEKLAANIAIARNIAGSHRRTDDTESLKLVEAVAIKVLRNQRAWYNEDFDGFTFTKFDGTTITVKRAESLRAHGLCDPQPRWTDSTQDLSESDEFLVTVLTHVGHFPRSW